MTPQAAVQTLPAPTGVPVPPAPPAVPLAAAPVSRADYRVLTARRGELSRQLSSAEGRRRDLLEELRQAPSDGVRAGVEARLQLLDARILQIETDIAANGRELAANPRAASQGAGSLVPSNGGMRMNDNAVPIMGIFSVLVLAPLAIAIARRIWKGAPQQVVRRDEQSDARLERIEQAVDAIAIEIERISESQRFQTRLLGEGQGIPATGFAKPRQGVSVGREG